MIQISKGKIPPRLAKSSKTLTAELKKKYLKGERKFKFTGAYHTKEVKQSLEVTHHMKCCFSEMKIFGNDSHVEHFRPKGRIDKWPSGPTEYPGYYWLAYEWSNLLLCKSTVNCSYKRNFFPLEDESKRNKSHLSKKTESPLLINPCEENPRDHIRFRGDEPIGLTKRGKCSIQLLKLKHPEFEEARRGKLKLLKLLRRHVDQALIKGHSINEPVIAETILALKEATQSNAEFSSMAKDFLSDWPHI